MLKTLRQEAFRFTGKHYQWQSHGHGFSPLRGEILAPTIGIDIDMIFDVQIFYYAPEMPF